ncbi:MAG: DUF1700 domain-containing protein [Oscillospiraceae bacterium]
MTKLEFIEALKIRLAHLPQSEAEKSISFYAESIDDRVEDGMSEEAAIADLGSMETIVENAEAEIPIAALVKSKLQKSHAKSSNKTLWMVLAICGVPFWLPLVLAFVVVVLALYCTIWVLIISLYAILFALALCGVAGMVCGGIYGVLISVSAGLMMGGMGIAALGLFLLCLRPILLLTKHLAIATVQLLKKTTGHFGAKKGVSV